MASTPNPATKLQHVRPVRPLYFLESEPAEEHLGQSKRHLELCFLLAELLKHVCAPQNSYGADQFVYWNPREPKTCLAPDGFVKLGVADEPFDTWKTWEKGVPELAIEILSPSDTPESLTFTSKLERYHELGVRELVCFDLDAPTGARLRVWDLIEGDMVERVVEGEQTPCLTLGPRFEWSIAPGAGYPTALRVRCDGAIVPTAAERAAALERERDALTHERDDALARIAELEARLRNA